MRRKHIKPLTFHGREKKFSISTHEPTHTTAIDGISISRQIILLRRVMLMNFLLISLNINLPNTTPTIIARKRTVPTASSDIQTPNLPIV